MRIKLFSILIVLTIMTTTYKMAYANSDFDHPMLSTIFFAFIVLSTIATLFFFLESPVKD